MKSIFVMPVRGCTVIIVPMSCTLSAAIGGHVQTVAKSNIGKYLFFLVQIQLRYHRIDLIICHLYGK